MLKQFGRNKMSNTKKLISTNLMQDMNFLSLKDFYNSIPDYSDINHLPEKEFYRQLAHLKKKQQELTKIKKKSSKDKLMFCEQHSRFASPNENSRKYSERISFLDDLNSENSWKNDHVQHTHSQSQSHSRNSQTNAGRSGAKRVTHSAMARPKSNVSEMAPNFSHSRISQVVDDYETLKHLRSKSISPTRSQLLNEIAVAKGCMNDDEKFYSDITNDKLTSLDHPKAHPAKTPPIPITSRIPLYEQINADQEHKNQLAKMDSAIKLQSKMKPFHFSESKSRCLSRSFSSPQLKIGESELDTEMNDESINDRNFKAKPFPKNMFCNYFHYKMWEDNYFRSMNKKLRAEELLKLSKLPPSMAKREKFCKIEENLADDCSRTGMNKLVDLPTKKKKFRKKVRKGTSKPKKVENLSQYSRSYIFDSKKEYHHNRDKASVKSDLTSTTTTKQTNDHKIINEGTPTPLYPVNRPNLAATLRYEWSREKIKLMEKEKEMIPQELCRRPNWGVKQTHAWQTMNYETSNEEEISMRLATRRAEQQLRQEEHEMNMALMNQRVKSTPLLLEGPTMLSPRLGHISHHCQVHNSSKKYSNNNLQIPKAHSSKGRPGSSKMSSYSTDSKGSSTNSKCT